MAGRRRISSGTSFEATMGYCRAVVVGDRVIVAGTAPQSPDGVVDPDPGAQARRCFTIIADALTGAGSSLAEVVRTRIYLVDAADFDAVAAVHGELFRDVRPVNTTVVIAGLLDPAWKLEVEVEAILGSAAEV
jgi:enamine deaminase RidA (YjgF/YER057c/UK114 family)